MIAMAFFISTCSSVIIRNYEPEKHHFLESPPINCLKEEQKMISHISQTCEIFWQIVAFA